MREAFRKALIAGCEGVTAWADLLDRINVFPVADGDTGRNLVVSLSPLRSPERTHREMDQYLLLSARGNSGNIASAFFRSFILGDTKETMPEAVRQGRDWARQAVPDPRPGTMLTFFDTLADIFREPDPATLFPDCLLRMEAAVRDTINRQPKLKEAGVVDAGALGMYLFFGAFLAAQREDGLSLPPVTKTFGELVRISPAYREAPERGYCVDMVLETGPGRKRIEAILDSLGESVVAGRDENRLKIHFHTRDREDARAKLAPCGEVLGWKEDDLYSQTSGFNRGPQDGPIHVMTDAAGSITRRQAREQNISLLDSYIQIGRQSFPETYLAPGVLYDAMRSGIRVSTSQASVFERHQRYAGATGLYERVLYLCVGSVYTGNYRTALDWKRDHDPDDRLSVIDTGAASGRLAVIALAATACAEKASHADEVIAFAQETLESAEEFIFLDRLAYLAAGGRLSRPAAFFGDALRMKPVITPRADGAQKAGLCRNRREQEDFALESIAKSVHPDDPALILLEYSDNQSQVEGFAATVRARYPEARVLVQPLSLTSGTHMGPGTWAVAFLPRFPR